MTPTQEQIAAAKSVLADIDIRGELDEAFALNVIATAIREAEIRGAERTWHQIETAPKDGTKIWACFRGDLAEIKDRQDLARWQGVQVPLRHPGLCEDGFDMGWNIAAPVGQGGFPDEWIAGWIDIPTPPENS